MLLLILQLPPLLRNARLLLLPCLNTGLALLALRLHDLVTLSGEVGELLNLGLVQAVDDGVNACRHEDLLHLLVIVKADLACGHGAILLQVAPWRVDDGDIVFLVSWKKC